MENYFNNNIKIIREKLKLSQNRFGELIKSDQTTIARWEDENRMPTIPKAIEICNILKIPLNILVGIDLSVDDNYEKFILKKEEEKQLSEEEEKQMVKEVLQKKGFLNENEEMTEEDFNKLIEFAKANKQFIMKDDK